MEKKVRQYQKNKNKKLREEIFNSLANLMWYCANHKWSKYNGDLDVGDYFSLSYFGFEKALDKYDGRMEFRAYVVQICDNFIIDYLRTYGPIKRTTFAKINKAKREKERLQQEKLREVRWAEILQGEYWDDLVEITETPVFEVDIPFYTQIEWKIELDWFFKRLARLDEKLQDIVLLKIKGDSFREIAKKYRVNPTTVFLWYHDAISKLGKKEKKNDV